MRRHATCCYPTDVMMLTPTSLTSSWDRIRTSYWFVPTLLSVVGTGPLNGGPLTWPI